MTTEVICPTCKKPAPWVENKEKYGKNYGTSYMCYFCKPCGTYVGCHNNTREPLGTMADKETMAWRKRAHDAIDPLWRNGGMSRGQMYARLSKYMGYEVHVGGSNIEQCKQIIEAVTFIKENKLRI